MSDDRKSSRDDLKVTTPHTANPVRTTGSQRAIDPNAPRASNPAMRRPSSGAIPAVPGRNTGSQRAIDPNAPRQSNPAMRRVSSPGMPRVSGSHPAHPPPQPDAGDGPTEHGVGLAEAGNAPTSPGSKAGDGPTAPGLKVNPRVSGSHKAHVEKKKVSVGKTIAFAFAVMLVFGVGVLWVLKHPELFPGADAAATAVAPPVKQPMLKAPPREPPAEAAETPPAKPEETKPAEAAADPKPEEAKPAADDGDDEIAKPEAGAKPGHRPVKHAAHAKVVAKAETEAPPAPDKPKEQAPPPSPEQLTEKTEQLEALLSKHESVRGPDPVVRGFLEKVKAETAAADTDDKKRATWAHLNQLQARLSK